MKKFLSLVLTSLLLLAGCATQQMPTNLPVQSMPIADRSQQSSLMDVEAKRYPSIALLLPLSGQLAEAGQAVRDGFMVGYYQQPYPAMKIKVIDTTQAGSVQAAYQQAVTAGARVVVGPLERTEVDSLATMGQFPVSTLTLNYTAISIGLPNFYQFGLSPLDEARQVAERATLAGSNAALIIVPAGHWGKGVANAFEQAWQARGGRIVKTLAYTHNQPLAGQVQGLLQGTKGADVVFMVASPAMARQITPLLKFYNAGNLPIYATSLIYDGKQALGVNQDLNGIIFCDIPWMVEPPVEQHQQFTKWWPKTFPVNKRLYALGMDAYQVALQLNDKPKANRELLLGVTGRLYINGQQQILRQLPWATFSNGKAVPLDTTAATLLPNAA